MFTDCDFLAHTDCYVSSDKRVIANPMLRRIIYAVCSEGIGAVNRDVISDIYPQVTCNEWKRLQYRKVFPKGDAPRFQQRLIVKKSLQVPPRLQTETALLIEHIMPTR